MEHVEGINEMRERTIVNHSMTKYKFKLQFVVMTLKDAGNYVVQLREKNPKRMFFVIDGHVDKKEARRCLQATGQIIRREGTDVRQGEFDDVFLDSYEPHELLDFRDN